MTNIAAIITKHAEKRARKRIGIPKKSVQKNAKRALEHGLCHADSTGRLSKYFTWLFLEHGNTNTRIYNDYVYIFTDDEVLVTVFPLERAHRSAAAKAIKRRETNHGS